MYGVDYGLKLFGVGHKSGVRMFSLQMVVCVSFLSHCPLLFVPYGLDGVEVRGTSCRQVSEEHADARADGKADAD